MIWIKSRKHNGNNSVRRFVARMRQLANAMQSNTSRSQGELARLRDSSAGIDTPRWCHFMQFTQFNRFECPWHEGFQSKATNGASKYTFVSVFAQHLIAFRWNSISVRKLNRFYWNGNIFRRIAKCKYIYSWMWHNNVENGRKYAKFRSLCMAWLCATSSGFSWNKK